MKLHKDRIPGVFSMELGWRGEPAWNQGEEVSTILRTASAEISSQFPEHWQGDVWLSATGSPNPSG